MPISAPVEVEVAPCRAAVRTEGARVSEALSTVTGCGERAVTAALSRLSSSPRSASSVGARPL